MSLSRHLSATFYQLCGRRHDKGRKATGRTGKKDFCKRIRSGRRITEERERAIVGHK